jgi:CYTH domain-containing protein
MTEIELTYLAKFLPKGLETCPSKRLVDIYYPLHVDHPVLRLRDKGGVYEMTKKKPLSSGDSSVQTEETIILSKEEYDSLAKLPGKRLEKKRFYYPYDGFIAEIDVFKGMFSGLVLVDFEFQTTEEKNAFKKPDFCLADVTQASFCAGGILAGKTFEDIASSLAPYRYQKLYE